MSPSWKVEKCVIVLNEARSQLDVSTAQDPQSRKKTRRKELFTLATSHPGVGVHIAIIRYS